MRKEELVVFPFIRKLLTSRDKVEHPRYDSIADPIQIMEEEHQGAQDVLIKLRKKREDYSNDIDKYGERLLPIIEKISALDNDLVHHMHLENNILFPKAIELERINKLIS
jgi:regulator of cell morphogenesis and NO signaling